MKLTREILLKGKSSNGGWNTEQIAALGDDIKVRGWKGRLIDKEIPDIKVKAFLDLKDHHLRQRMMSGGKLRDKTLQKMKILNFSPIPYPLNNQQQYLHPNWQMMRLFVLTRDKFSCVNCNAIDKTLHAHHLKYLKDKYVWQVPHWYIVTLCEDCHSEEHGRDLRAH